MSEIELKGRELLHITNALYHGACCVELEDKKSLFYNILDVSGDYCLECFVNNVHSRMLSHISIKLLSFNLLKNEVKVLSNRKKVKI